jgi:hypothetical protein
VHTTDVCAVRVWKILALPTGEATSPHLWSWGGVAVPAQHPIVAIVLATLLLTKNEALPRGRIAACADVISADVLRLADLSLDPVDPSGGAALLLGHDFAVEVLEAADAGL